MNAAPLQRAAEALRAPDPAAAADICQAHLRANPDDPNALNLLAAARAAQHRLAEAIRHAGRAAYLRPDHGPFHKNLAALYLRAGDAEAAAAALSRALQANPDDRPARQNLASVLMELARYEEAESHWRALADADPSDPAVAASLTTTLARLARTDDAQRALSRHLSSDPPDDRVAVAMHELATTDDQKNTAEHALRRALQSASPPPRRAVNAHAALAKLLEHRGEHDEAFAHYQAANRITADSLPPHDPDAWSRRVDELLAAYHQGADPLRSTTDSRTPVFIVGMPRSGTTLIEQIVARHPKAHAAGEQRTIPAAIARLEADHPDAPFPACAHLLRTPNLTSAADTALTDYRARAVNPDATRISDKLPANLFFLGFVRQLFPQAPVIICRRNALDVCASCYTTQFARGHAFTTDQTHLARYFADAHRAAKHYAESLDPPPLTVEYERLIADPRAQTERILDHLALSWDNRCLNFHESADRVRTASRDQVRRPLYATSIARWRRFAPHLAPLLCELDRAGLLPEDARDAPPSHPG